MTKASDNLFPSVLMQNTSNSAIGTPSPWNAQRLFFDADGSLKRIDANDNVQAVEGGGTITFGGVSSTDTVTVASNFAVSDQGGGTARLDVFFPASGGTGLSTGTSFPGTPSTGDRYRRSDLDYEIFFFDGTQWVSETLFRADFGTLSNISTSPSIAPFSPGLHVANGLQTFIVDFMAYPYVNGTNNGSNYWTANLRSWDSSSSDTTEASVNTSAGSGSSVLALIANDNTAIASGQRFLDVQVVKTGSPGNLYMRCLATYRLIAT